MKKPPIFSVHLRFVAEVSALTDIKVDLRFRMDDAGKRGGEEMPRDRKAEAQQSLAKEGSRGPGLFALMALPTALMEGLVTAL